MNSVNLSNTIVYSTIKSGPCQINRLKEGVNVSYIDNGDVSYHPAVDPTGKFMIYTSDIGGTTALYVKDLLNSDEAPRRLLEGEFMQDKAAFSPNGQTLYFVGTRDGATDIYSLPFSPNTTASASDAINLTKNSGGKSSFSPAISPCGNWMAFSSNQHCQPPFESGPMLSPNYKAGNLYLMKLEDLSFERIYPSNDWQGSPCWSREESTIYFYAVVEGKTRLHSCDINNMQVQIVKGLKEREILSSAFSPQGRLAFIEKNGSHSFIASVDLKKNDLDYRVENSQLSLDLAFDPNGEIFSSSLKKADDEFGEGISSKTYLAGRGPFFVGKREIVLQTGEKINLMGVRGYFPNLIPQTDEMIAFKDFSSIHRIKAGEWKSKCIFEFPENIFGLGLSVSPDGKSAVTSAGAPFDNKGRKHIYLINLENGNATDLTPDSDFNDTFPAFTPKGGILFSRTCDTVLEHKNIFLRENSGELTRLTYTKGIDSMASMSLKGNKIVYVSKRGEESNYTFNLFMLKFDKVENVWRESCLLKSDEPFAHPKFSVDGKNIVCTTGMFGLAEETPVLPVRIPQSSGEIIMMNLKTKQIDRLTANMGENSLPHFG